MNYWRRKRDVQSREYELINGIIGTMWDLGVPVVLVVHEVGPVWLRIVFICLWVVKMGPIGYNVIPSLTNPWFDVIAKLLKRDKHR